MNGLLKMVGMCSNGSKMFFDFHFGFYLMIKDDLEDFELEDFFLDTMNNEFDTILDDNSEAQVARNVLGAYRLYKTQQYTHLQNEIDKLKQMNATSNTKASVKVETNESSSEEDEEDENDEDVEMNTEEADENNNEAENKKKAELEQEMEAVEEGWTYVAKSGKHYTK